MDRRARGRKPGKPRPGSALASPNGRAAATARLIWARDGDSSVRIVDIPSHRVIDTVATGGARRMDELAHDLRAHIVVAANNADRPLFISFVSTTEEHRVEGRLTQSRAGFPANSLFLVPPSGRLLRSFPEVDSSDDVRFDSVRERDHRSTVANPGGPVPGVIDARDNRWEASRPTGPRAPSGAAAGSTGQVLVPIAANDARPECNAGRGAVFAART